MGLTSTATATASSKPTGGVAKRAQGSTSTAFYTVPAGKYFVGVVFARSHQYGFRIHSADGSAYFCNGGPNNPDMVNHPVNITLYEGMGISSGNSSYQVGLAGVLYDL